MTPIPEAPSTNTQLPFDIDDRSDQTLIIAYAWVPLVIELFRSMGAAQAINDAGHIKQRRRGLMPAQLVETLRALRGNTSEGRIPLPTDLCINIPGFLMSDLELCTVRDSSCCFANHLPNSRHISTLLTSTIPNLNHP